MGVTAKLFIQNRTEFPGTSQFTYNLGVVCRGEENKHWAAATPSGSMTVGQSDLLDSVWGADVREIEATIFPDDNGDWLFDNCAFSYGGCQVAFRQTNAPYGKLGLTINASKATQVLRESYAEGLMSGTQPKYSVFLALPR